jgi:hypothetical protein
MCRHVPTSANGNGVDGINAIEEEVEEVEEEDDYDYVYDPENNGSIRGKWQMDGAETLDEAIVKLQDLIAYIRTLQEEGWELTDAIGDDYGHIRRTAPQRDPAPTPVVAAAETATVAE